MKIFFSVSSRSTIADKYILDVDYISKKLAEVGYDLVIGVAQEEGMPGRVLNNFKTKNRKIFLKTLKIYKENPQKFDYINFEYVANTFDRTKRIFETSDILLINYGGTGTVAEIFSFIEELKVEKLKNGEITKKLIIYNKDNYYDSIFNFINETIINLFSDQSVEAYFKVFTDADELIEYLSTYIREDIKIKIRN